MPGRRHVSGSQCTRFALQCRAWLPRDLEHGYSSVMAASWAYRLRSRRAVMALAAAVSVALGSACTTSSHSARPQLYSSVREAVTKQCGATSLGGWVGYRDSTRPYVVWANRSERNVIASLVRTRHGKYRVLNCVEVRFSHGELAET